MPFSFKKIVLFSQKYFYILGCKKKFAPKDRYDVAQAMGSSHRPA